MTLTQGHTLTTMIFRFITNQPLSLSAAWVAIVGIQMAQASNATQATSKDMHYQKQHSINVCVNGL